MRLIAFCGYMGSGKSFAADYLIEKYGYTRVKFAGPLKDMLHTMGLTEEEIEGGDKDKPSDLLCGRTPRWAMQSLGTEWGRECIGENLWGKPMGKSGVRTDEEQASSGSRRLSLRQRSSEGEAPRGVSLLTDEQDIRNRRNAP